MALDLLAQGGVDYLVKTIVIVVYLLLVGYLAFRGFRRTKTTSDYLLAGRQMHPYVMALSYGATFISTSAIVGFGGFASIFGFSILWLTFLNIFVGIFIAFVFLGGPTRRMGHRLDAHTFPELLGRRFGSKFIQFFAACDVRLHYGPTWNDDLKAFYRWKVDGKDYGLERLSKRLFDQAHHALEPADRIVLQPQGEGQVEHQV